MTILGYGTHAGHKYRHITKATLNRRVIKKEALCGGIRTERANQATDEIWDLVEPTVREVKAEGWDDGKAAAVAIRAEVQR